MKNQIKCHLPPVFLFSFITNDTRVYWLAAAILSLFSRRLTPSSNN